VNGVPPIIVVNGIDLILGPAIPNEGLFFHLQRIPGNAYHPLHIHSTWIVRRSEYDYVSPLRVSNGRQTDGGSRDFSSVQGFVYEKEVAYEKGPLHGGGRDGEGLQGEPSDKQEKYESDGCEPKPIPKDPKAGREQVHT
jgi:hypothetical protein